MLAAVFTRGFQLLNLAEAGLWIIIGLVAATLSFRSRRGAARLDLLILSIALVAFGFSDLVETRTGAWWKPPWLLALKSACVLVMLILLVRYVRRRRHHGSRPGQREASGRPRLAPGQEGT